MNKTTIPNQKTRTANKQEENNLLSSVFAVSAEHRTKKIKRKREKYLDLAKLQKKTMQNEGDSDTNWCWLLATIVKDQNGDLIIGNNNDNNNNRNNKVDTLIQTVRMYSQDIRMEFVIEKGAMLVIKNGKWNMTEGVELPNQEKIRTLGEKETYKYLGILEADSSKQVEMKENNSKEYLRRTRKLLETKLYGRNLVKGINTGTAPPRKILGAILGVDQK